MIPQEVARTLSRRVVAVCTLLFIGFAFFAFPGATVASARTRTPAPPPCSELANLILNSKHREYCVAPTVVNDPFHHCGTTLQHPTQSWGGTDVWNASIHTTLTDEHNTCVIVDYSLSPSPTFSSCSYSFYIPAGPLATATFQYFWSDSGGNHTGSINENGLAGWTTLFHSISAIHMRFTDNDAPGNRDLSWGSDPAYSLKADCSSASFITVI